jgi:protein-export membrane protein SecD
VARRRDAERDRGRGDWRGRPAAGDGTARRARLAHIVGDCPHDLWGVPWKSWVTQQLARLGFTVVDGDRATAPFDGSILLLRAGALPAELTILEERTVGPGLGADSVRAGQIACILGMVFVIVFMAMTYGLFGLMANVALITNLVLILGALSAMQATLTLPGIAGIVLTIGMAVDANVLIFERVREETRNGRGPVTAIDAGYRRAMTTILDSNLTTLFAAILLFAFGSGPVKGFAVTLAIGLITSMFTAIMLTRGLVILWLRRRRPQTLPI